MRRKWLRASAGERGGMGAWARQRPDMEERGEREGGERKRERLYRVEKQNIDRGGGGQERERPECW